MFLLCFSLLILNIVGTLDCYTDLQITQVHVIARTSSLNGADSNQQPTACLSFKDADTACYKLPELKGPDMETSKGSWWPMDDWNGRKLCDIEAFQLKNGGNNGWGFDDLFVLVEGTDGKAYVAVQKYGPPTLWLDGDSSNDQKVQHFPILEDFGKPKGDATNADTISVYFLAQSAGDTGEIETFHIKSNGIPYSEELYNNEGNDMEVYRTDIWQLEDFKYMQVNRVDQISVSSGGNDGWTFDRAAVIIYTSMGYYIPVLQSGAHEIDSDTAGKEEYAFEFLHNWNLEFYEPEDLVRGGYWTYVTAVDPWETFTVSQTARFYSESGNIQEQSQMDSFSNTYSQGGSFSFCQSGGVDIGKFSAESEACSEKNWSEDQTSGWEKTTSQSVEARTGEETEITCTHEYSCPGPTIIKPDDVPDLIMNEEKCYVYMWVTFTYNSVSGYMEVLETCQFDLIEHHGNAPMCVPGQCIDSTDCQECYEGPQPPRSELSIGAMVSQHFMQYYWMYGGMSILLVAGFYFKYQSNKKETEDYQLLNMARLSGSYSA